MVRHSWSALSPRLELRGIIKRFGAAHALDGVDLDVHAGEVVALVGDNGAGKSTLVKIIAGLFPADAGEMRFEGRPIRPVGPKAAAGLGIATVYQDLALCDNLDVVANLFLGREKLRHSRLLDEEAMESRALELLAVLNVSLPSLRIPAAMLSGGQRQSVAVARAILDDAKLVLMDEPTAALGVTQTSHLFELVLRLRERGLAVVLVSHNLADVFRVADRIVVLRLGRLAGTFVTKETTREEVVARITGATVGAGGAAE